MGGCVLYIRDSLGHAKFYCNFIGLLEELVWEAWLGYLEHDTRLFNVVCLEREESLFV